MNDSIWKTVQENVELKKVNQELKAELERLQCNLNNTRTEIEILIRKKESLRDEIYELQSEVERLKEFEYAYNRLFK